MHFSSINQNSGSKVTKIAVVGLFHVVLALGLIHATGHGFIKLAPPDPFFRPLPPEPEKFPVDPPVQPSEPTPLPIQQFVIDPPIIEVQEEHPVTLPPQAKVETGTEPFKPLVKSEPAHGGGGAGTPEASNPGKMRTAVLADGCALPDYPAKSARNGDSGTVTLALLVGANGQVMDSRITRSSGFRELDKAAQSALSMCKFKAATNGGVAEQGWSQIAYVWNLD